MTANRLPGVLIYRNDLLERSETFISAQAESLRRYQPTFCGLHRRATGILPETASTILLGREKGFAATLRRTLYLQTGSAPGWTAHLAAQQCSLMHAHFALDAACALPLAEKLDLPLIVTLHGYDVTTSPATFRQTRGGRLYLRRQAALFRRAHTFICVSEFIRERALKAGFPAHKLWVHSIGIDLAAFRPEPFQAPGPSDSPLILFVGRLVEKKGCIHLLRALQIIQRTHPARAVIIGDGPLRQQLESTARDLGLQHCSFLGSQPAAVIRGWLQQSTVFSVPSITAANGDSEGLGMVFCEAQAMSVPVVSFATGGIPEAVLNGITGFLVPELDHVGLAARISLLIANQPLHAQMSASGRAHAASRFDLTKQTTLLEARYDSALASHAPRLPALQTSQATLVPPSQQEQQHALLTRQDSPALPRTAPTGNRWPA